MNHFEIRQSNLELPMREEMHPMCSEGNGSHFGIKDVPTNLAPPGPDQCKLSLGHLPSSSSSFVVREEKRSCLKTQARPRIPQGRIRFCETVAMHTFHEEEYDKSYTKRDVMAFKTQILAIAGRVHEGLKNISVEYGIECTKPNVKLFMISPSLIQRIGVDPEEMIGIEHLINDAKPAVVIMVQREDMVHALLEEQRFQRVMWAFDSRKIAAISECCSMQAVKRALRKAQYVHMLCN